MKNVGIPLILLFSICQFCFGQQPVNLSPNDSDQKIQKFLENNKRQWRDLNVPYEDGQVLYDLIVNNGYKNALEIGTSTGHSTIWIAWALSKTGGKLITLEIDGRRQQQAKKQIDELGLSQFVEFRLGDAHKLVKEVKGPLDFVFSDADKDWYIQYFKDVHPKLIKGGRFTAHNVLQNQSGIKEYLEFVQAHPDYSTTIDRSSNSGIAISLKK